MLADLWVVMRENRSPQGFANVMIPPRRVYRPLSRCQEWPSSVALGAWWRLSARSAIVMRLGDGDAAPRPRSPALGKVPTDPFLAAWEKTNVGCPPAQPQNPAAV
ncbi:hypothetical protein GGTG_13116 [Gaeumannomyces tritici R3-111a-1]|uniref:Uncharacterized protein n=1 Tax=Gaeumannomyces tritici (strain R3-111a-1) TaxID=644352 RepID=J3PHY5_GAET3|nr:hypothetical protein GGTG_13116 [Gaeumannomyces tritici R3-111a-1]EJT69497.1 hypothetical protein GGTG_13116 [Gaeumannomyces tritici R3-111a-1]